MRVAVLNAQRRYPVSPARIERLVRRAARQLKIRTVGTFSIAFLTPARMRTMNRRALRHNRVTDVITFRYDQEPMVGEILVAPSEAAAYAKEHGVAYDEELSRYVVHGLLHWLGHDDRTPAEQRRMRRMEDELLSRGY